MEKKRVSDLKKYFFIIYIMRNIEINNCIYKVHPIYDLYASDENGNVINLTKKVPFIGNKHNNGYLFCNVRKHGQKEQKGYLVHRFIYECFESMIPDGKVIDHINDIKDDNRLCNLQMITHQENCEKTAKGRDYSFVAKNHQNRKCVKTINCETNEVSFYNSMHAVEQHLGINAGIVKMVCEKINNCKTGISKKDNHSYKFEYVDEQDMPADYKKSANIRPSKVPIEDRKKHITEAIKKWQQKKFECPKCGKTYTNGYKYIHNKICK